MGFHVFIDDSGSDGPVWDTNGNFRDTAQKTLCCAAVLVEESAVTAMEGRWGVLLDMISTELGVEARSVPVHMRLLYGQELGQYNDVKRSRKNPFYEVPARTRLEWMEIAWGIIDAFYDQDKAFVVANVTTKASQYDQQKLFIGSERHRNEVVHLKDLAFQRGIVKEFNKFYGLVANSMTMMIAQLVIHLNNLMVEAGKGPITVFCDDSPSSKGFDAGKALEVVKDRKGLEQVSCIIPASTREQTLLQVADFLTFCEKRIFEVRELGRVDPIISRWVTRHRMPYWRAGIKNLKDGDGAIVLALHYELALRAFSDKHPAFAGEFLCPVNEFFDRAKRCIDLNHRGVSVLRDPPVPSW